VVGSRPYQLKARARQMEAIRRRITEVAVALHEEVGPAATTVSEIARRAGVQRATVYNHFPDEASLLASCSAHWLQQAPPPDPGSWAAIEDAGARTRTALLELYSHYRATERMTGNVLRDAHAMPALHELLKPLGAFLDQVSTLLAEAWQVDDVDRLAQLHRTLRHAVEFTTWRGLTSTQGLDDGAAVDLVMAWVAGVGAAHRQVGRPDRQGGGRRGDGRSTGPA